MMTKLLVLFGFSLLGIGAGYVLTRIAPEEIKGARAYTKPVRFLLGAKRSILPLFALYFVGILLMFFVEMWIQQVIITVLFLYGFIVGIELREYNRKARS